MNAKRTIVREQIIVRGRELQWVNKVLRVKKKSVREHTTVSTLHTSRLCILVEATRFTIAQRMLVCQNQELAQSVFIRIPYVPGQSGQRPNSLQARTDRDHH